MTTFTGKAGVSTFQALVLKQGLKLFAATGMKPNRQWTPSAMMKLAASITGKKFKARDYLGAVAELEKWIAENGATADPVTA
jgi:hypothetical protein